MSTNLTREYLVDWIKRQLGHPIVEVELTNDQLDDCIEFALDEVAPWVVQRQYVTLPANECIDLSTYNISYVINVHKANVSNPNKLDVFNDTRAVIRGSGSIYQTDLYTKLEDQLLDNIINSTKDNISFRYIKPKLYLDVGYPPSTEITIEYSPEITESNVTDRLYQKYLKQFALAQARSILSDIRGKYSVTNAIAELDGSTQESKSSAELDRLRQEIKNTVSAQFITD